MLDENLSDRIISRIADLYPGSTHLKTHSLIHMDDTMIWDFVKSGDYMITSKDWDFHQLSLLRGFPPKVIYLDIGNCSTQEIVNLLRDKVSDIQTFYDNPLESLLILNKP